jgi:hypothetical protein
VRGSGANVEGNEAFKPRGFLELVQINPNSWSGIKEWLENEVGGKTQVVCGQEHRLAAPELEAACVSAKGIGWNLSAAPAVITALKGDGRHRSAGTLVAVASHVGSELLYEFGKADLSPPEAPGRLSARWGNMLGREHDACGVFQQWLSAVHEWSDGGTKGRHV